MMDINLALWKLNPNFYYTCPNGLYVNLVMLDNNPKPSLEALQSAWLAYLANEGKSIALLKLEVLAEQERLKYITVGSGKAMAYQQQQREVELWQSGNNNPNRYKLANEIANKLGVPYTAILAQWENNINAWLIIGGKIEANLAKYKVDLINLNVTSQSDLDDFLASVNFNL